MTIAEESNAGAGRFWEDFSVGQTFKTRGRTVTETDVVGFAGISGDFHPIHVDEVYASKSPFGRRIAHGLLGLTIADGLSQAQGLMGGTIIAFLGLEWKFVAPIFIGDTVHEEQEVSSLRETKDAERGILTLNCRLTNQKGEVVQEGKRTVLIARRSLG